MNDMKKEIEKFKNEKWYINDKMDERTVSYIYSVVKKLESSGAMRDVDEGSLYILASQFDIYCKSMDQVMTEGPIEKSLKGGNKQHPCIIIASKAFMCMNSILRDYGLTARSAEKIKSVAPKEEDSPLTAFLKKQAEED